MSTHAIPCVQVGNVAPNAADPSSPPVSSAHADGRRTAPTEAALLALVIIALGQPLTQDECADLLDIEQSTISDIERGAIRKLRARVLRSMTPREEWAVTHG